MNSRALAVVNMVVADNLTPIWRQGIYNYHIALRRSKSSEFKSAALLRNGTSYLYKVFFFFDIS